MKRKTLFRVTVPIIRVNKLIEKFHWKYCASACFGVFVLFKFWRCEIKCTSFKYLYMMDFRNYWKKRGNYICVLLAFQ